MAAVTAMSMSVTAFADEPYNSYNYDTWDDAVPSQSAYMTVTTITGEQMKLERLRDPSDELYVSESAPVTLADSRDMCIDDARKQLWVADTKNNRLLQLNLDTYEIEGVYTGVSDGGSESSFAGPQGVFVAESDELGGQAIYIADTDNSRVVKAKVKDGRTLELVTEYTKPEDPLYTVNTFNPKKVLADKAENVYTVVNAVNTGSVLFARGGDFKGFYGANRVNVTAAVIAQRIWRAIASEAQLEGMTRNVPIEYANFDIDLDGFIYTVTEINTDTDSVKKLNPAGYNIWNNAKGNEYKFGDITGPMWDPIANKTHNIRLTDLDISSTGLINVLDFETGRVFQYDKECNLVCIFGTKTSTNDQRGAMANPNAVETYGNKVYVLDGAKSDITVFQETQFGKYIHNAFALYDEGRYVDAKDDWNEVIKRDGGYTWAYIGLGKAALNQEQYTKALKYFKTAYDQDDYDKAYKYAREAFLRDHFTAIIVIIVLLIALIIVRKVMKKKGMKLIKRKAKPILATAGPSIPPPANDIEETVDEAEAEVSETVEAVEDTADAVEEEVSEAAEEVTDAAEELTEETEDKEGE